MQGTMIKTDRELRHNVTEALDFDPLVHAAQIGVGVNDGVVTLSGTVPSYFERVEACRAALRVQGVQALADELEVDLPGTHVRNDEDIARDIHNALSVNLLVPEEGVKVLVHGGMVTVSGEVDWHFQKEAAERAARLVGGVKAVSDLVTVRARPQADWAGVKRAISSAFQRHASLDAKKVEVQIDGGTVTLRGAVRSWPERQDAERAAWSAPGVHAVVNTLEVRPTA